MPAKHQNLFQSVHPHNVMYSTVDSFDETDLKVMNLIFSTYLRKVCKRISKEYDIEYDELCNFVGKSNIKEPIIVLDRSKLVKEKTNLTRRRKKKTPMKNKKNSDYVFDENPPVTPPISPKEGKLNVLPPEVRRKRGRPRKHPLTPPHDPNVEILEEMNPYEMIDEPKGSYFSDSDTSDSDYESISCKVIEWKGKEYLLDEDCNVYDRYEPNDLVGKWVNESLHIDCACDLEKIMANK